MELYDYEKKHIELLRKAACECMVLLKSDGTFPLEKACEVALYGSGARKTIKGGTGSGDVNVRHYVTIEEGLKNAGFQVTTSDWMDEYEVKYKDARKLFVKEIKQDADKKGMPAFLLGMGAVMPEPEYELPIQKDGDLAIYVLSRISGEGSDRKPIAGDLKLTKTEVRDILYLNEHFQKFMLVLNVGGIVDLSPVNHVKNILLLSQPGMTVGDSFADVILGKQYPSGKLSATWSTWEDYDSEMDFGNPDDTVYSEGMMVGYRYFDTKKIVPMYSFGFGNGYTTFRWNVTNVKQQHTKMNLSVNVENVGDFRGKEVVQVYVSMPSGKIIQPYQMLVAFQKTKELMPGEQDELNLCFDLQQFASYESDTSSRILEKGDYVVWVGTSSRDTRDCARISLKENIVVEQLQTIGQDSVDTYGTVKRSDQIKEYEDWLNRLSDEELAYLCVGGFQEKGSQSIVGNAGMKVAGAAGETTSIFTKEGLPSLVMADGPAGLRLSRQYGVDEDGIYAVGDEIPAALVEFVDEKILAMLGNSKGVKKERNGATYNQYCSAIPIGTALAQSWNVTLANECGNLVGEEMERFGVNIWLAPALNIQRSPLCGRNFEYYSEDPFISGKMAAAITKGVQSHPGCGVTVKHFCCNNQETNRFHSNSVVDERTLRDLYLRGFEIAIKEANPAAVMTSYNLLNGEHTSQRRDLNVMVLRNEWGYRGLVMSDWLVSGFAMEHKYPSACAAGCIKAGNDLIMPGGEAEIQNIMEALHHPDSKYSISRRDLEECAASVIRTVKAFV